MVDHQEAAPELDAGQLLVQIYLLWVQPELDRRGLTIRPEQLIKALVVMSPGRPIAVLLDDEVRLVASVRATRALARGNPIRTGVERARTSRPRTDPDLPEH